MLIAVRHGTTKMNGSSGDDKFRGQEEYPLNNEGFKQSEETADILKKYNFPIDSYYTSPLNRAVQSSNEIEDRLGVNFQARNELNDWDIGDFAGKPVKEYMDEVHHYIDNPGKKIPNGESFDSLVHRAVPFLKKLVEDDNTHLAVTHNRLVTILKSLATNKGKSLATSVLKKDGPIKPGGIMIVNPDWSIEILHRESGHEN